MRMAAATNSPSTIGRKKAKNVNIKHPINRNAYMIKFCQKLIFLANPSLYTIADMMKTRANRI